MPFSLQTGGSGGLAAVAHDATLRGSGTAADPIGLAAAETAKIDEAHDVHRAVLARWTVTAADLRIGASIASYGFTRIIYASADGEPTQTAGGIDPAPATLSEGGDSWRLVAVRQDAASHEIEIVLGAPLGDRTVHARGRIDFAAANQFVEVPGAHRIPASRDAAYEVEAPSGGGQFTRLEVTADQLRALTPAARGQSSTPQGHSVELGTENGLTYRAGRTALGVILLSMSSAGAQNVGVFSDDSPPGADPPDVPTWIDWRLGARTLRGRAAEIGGADREPPPFPLQPSAGNELLLHGPRWPPAIEIDPARSRATSRSLQPAAARRRERHRRRPIPASHAASSTRPGHQAVQLIQDESVRQIRGCSVVGAPAPAGDVRVTVRPPVVAQQDEDGARPAGRLEVQGDFGVLRRVDGRGRGALRHSPEDSLRLRLRGGADFGKIVLRDFVVDLRQLRQRVREPAWLRRAGAPERVARARSNR